VITLTKVQLENKNDIAILTLDNGVTNPIDLDLASNLIELLSNIEQESKVLMITSSNTKFFSIGFDIPSLIKMNKDEFIEFYDAFNKLCLKLYSLNIPTMALITGHCVAAGCIIAACTNYRLASKPNSKIGITATKLGLPIPYLAGNILRQVVDDPNNYDQLTSGNLYDMVWGSRIGFIDKIVETQDIIKEAEVGLNQIFSEPDQLVINRKNSKIKQVQEEYFNNKAIDTKLFLEKWFSKEVQENLHEAVKKF
jgi:enoyl-CoA hydratase/carnithine racemase